MTSPNEMGQSDGAAVGQAPGATAPNPPPYKGDGAALTQPSGEDDIWTQLEALGRQSGHVVCRCPKCGERAMVAYRPKSQPWPYCRSCTPGSLTANRDHGAPRVVPVSDVTKVSKRPGQPRTKTQALKDGDVYTRRLPDALDP